MTKRIDPDISSTPASRSFQTEPNVLYSLDAAAYLEGVPRRSILTYCRSGRARPVFQAPDGVVEFTGEAIHTDRRIEHLRTAYGFDLAWHFLGDQWRSRPRHSHGRKTDDRALAIARRENSAREGGSANGNAGD